MKKQKVLSLLLVALLSLALALPAFGSSLKAEETEPEDVALQTDELPEEEQEAEELAEKVSEAPAEETEEAPSEEANAPLPEDIVVAKINGDTEVSLLEMNFQAGLLFQQLAQTPAFVPQASSILNQLVPGDEGEQVPLRDLVFKFLQEDLPLKAKVVKLAQEADTELKDSDKALVDNFFNSFAQNAIQNGMSPNQLLEQFFGPGATVEKLRPFVEKDLLQSLYLENLYNSYEVSEDAITAEYEANPDLYDLVDFYLIQLDPEISEEDLATVKSTLDKVTEKDFAEKLAPYSGKGEDEQASVVEKSLQKGVAKKDMIPASGDWLFDPARKAGDTTLIEGEKSQSALLFVSRYRDEARNYDSRHILIKEAGDTELDYQVATATVNALMEGLKGEISEDFFAELAGKYSQDPGSNQNGGLYEDVAPGRFVKAYEDFCLDPNTQEGQIGLVHVTQDDAGYAGYHIIYFKGLRDANWLRAVESNIRAAKQADAIDKMKEGTSFEFVDQGRDLVMPVATPAATEESEPAEEAFISTLIRVIRGCSRN